MKWQPRKKVGDEEGPGCPGRRGRGRTPVPVPAPVPGRVFPAAAVAGGAANFTLPGGACRAAPRPGRRRGAEGPAPPRGPGRAVRRAVS